MAFARDPYTATGGQTDFTITFPYEDQDDVLVYQNGTLLTLTTDYTFFNSTTIRLNSGATSGDTIILQRSTSQSSKNVTFTAGTLTSTDMNNATNQLFYMAQEAIDIANTALGLGTDDNWDATSKLIKNVTDPTDAQDAATKNYVDGVALGSFPSPLAIGSGGTGGATAAAARTSLGLEIGTDVQAEVITTRGDIIRGSSTGTTERLALGASGTVLKSDGTDAAWGAIDGVLKTVQVFTSNDTYTKPAGLVRAEVWVIGGGGGGAGAAASNTLGGGGGGGGAAYKLMEAASISATETVTIGAGGAGGSAGANAGTAGGTTSFGSLLQATGGGAGPTSGRATGGVGSLGDLNLTGGAGGSFAAVGATDVGATNMGGAGAGPYGGPSTPSHGGNQAGLAGQGYGSGGAGGNANTVSQAGGAGADGIVIVKEYY